MDCPKALALQSGVRQCYISSWCRLQHKQSGLFYLVSAVSAEAIFLCREWSKNWLIHVCSALDRLSKGTCDRRNNFIFIPDCWQSLWAIAVPELRCCLFWAQHFSCHPVCARQVLVQCSHTALPLQMRFICAPSEQQWQHQTPHGNADLIPFFFFSVANS